MYRIWYRNKKTGEYGYAVADRGSNAGCICEFKRASAARNFARNRWWLIDNPALVDSEGNTEPIAMEEFEE